MNTTYVNPNVRHQRKQAPLFTADGTDGLSLPAEAVALRVLDFEALWDTYEIWRNRMQWLGEHRLRKKLGGAS